jgi:hypothetical protein
MRALWPSHNSCALALWSRSRGRRSLTKRGPAVNGPSWFVVRNKPRWPPKCLNSRKEFTMSPMDSRWTRLLTFSPQQPRDHSFAVDQGAASGRQYAKNASGIHSSGN